MRSPAGRRGETTEPDGIWFHAIGSSPSNHHALWPDEGAADPGRSEKD